jgi:hypothetical protein
LCRKDQSAALLRLKSGFHLNPAVSNLSSWEANTDCCTWERIRCDGETGRVTALDLSNLSISGNISSDIFINLTSLHFLSLSNNFFHGSPWPSPGLDNLTNLSYSGLSGYLPIKNGQFARLVTLDLSGLDLQSWTLDTLIDSLGSLQKLYLDRVNINVYKSSD